MPGFDGVLTAQEIDELIDVIEAFDPKAFATSGKPFVLGPARPRASERGAYLWNQLACDHCHGARGHGDGPSAKTMADPPYDLVAFPLRRPRAADDLVARRLAAALSIATGMAGTAMPGYGGQVSEADLWALADHVVELGARAERRDRSVLDDDAIRHNKIEIATWPGDDPVEARVFGAPLAAQGPPLPQLAPSQASLRSPQCGRCHTKQLREWATTIHGAAASPGLLAQIDGELPAAEVAKCVRCHTPLAEQASDSVLRGEGVTCAACHVRGWVRNGPPRIAPSLLAAQGYPLVELALYERGDFCLPCHQLPPQTAVAGKPLLNTYKEWLEGPYMRRGIQCQHCHMSNREHTWRGVHDRDALRAAIRLDASAHRSDGVVTVLAELRNIGAGHYLPTTPTPAMWLAIELYDARGIAIAGARARVRIGRELDLELHELNDTRIPPGDTRAVARAWRTDRATTARVTVEVEPDEYYERFYESKLRGKPVARGLYEQALARARSSHYIADQRDVPIAVSSIR